MVQSPWLPAIGRKPVTCDTLVKLVGHPGYAPGVSRSQAERIPIFLVPDEIGGRDG